LFRNGRHAGGVYVVRYKRHLVGRNAERKLSGDRGSVIWLLRKKKGVQMWRRGRSEGVLPSANRVVKVFAQ